MDRIEKTDQSIKVTTQVTANTNLANLLTMEPSTTIYSKELDMKDLRAGQSMSHYSERILEDILEEIFAERRGFFPETSSGCASDLERVKLKGEPHVDKRLKYWREVLEKRRKLHQRVLEKTGKQPQQVLFNRRSTLEHRNKETFVRLLDYAERLDPETLAAKPLSKLKDLEDPYCCECLDPVNETWPKPERLGYKDVEIIGLPNITQQELLGSEAAKRELDHTWMKSNVLDQRIDDRFTNIHNVLEFFPNLNDLQVTGTNIEKLKSQPKAEFLGEDELCTISTSNLEFLEEEQNLESWSDQPTYELEPEPQVPEIGIKINGKDYVVCEVPYSNFFELTTKFKSDPFQRRTNRILTLTNIGKQTLSFKWTQGTYYYNRGSLLLAKDNEFLFNTDNFRLAYGETFQLVVLYQPRKVGMSVELWRLHIDPRIFCGSQESLVLRFHGCCTAPKDYIARIREMQCNAICKLNTIDMNELTTQIASLVPIIEPPPACCPYERSLDERELFNSLNPGFNCTRFDDLEVLKGMHKHLKKPREPIWDLRLQTIKMLILRMEGFDNRQVMFTQYMVMVESLREVAPSLEAISQLADQKQRTRLIFVRGAICNCIEEWEDIVFTIGESFYKSELQNLYVKQLKEAEEEEEDESSIKIEDITLDKIEADEDKIKFEVLRKLQHSKYFRDTLYMQTYSHLCNIAENIVSIIESTDIVPT